MGPFMFFRDPDGIGWSIQQILARDRPSQRAAFRTAVGRASIRAPR